MKATYGRANRPALPLSAQPGAAPSDAGSGGQSVFAALADHTHPIDAARVYNAKRYGAKGDGATDDRPAIQAAVDAANAAGGGTVYVPEGTHVVDYAVRVKSNVHLRGAGKGRTVIKLRNNATTTQSLMDTNDGAVVNVRDSDDVVISDLSVDGNRANNVNVPIVVPGAYRNGITVSGAYLTAGRCNRVLLRDVEVYETCATPIEVALSNDVTLLRCVGRDGGKSGGQYDPDVNAINVSIYTQRVIVRECEGWRCKHGGIELYMGALSAGVSTSTDFLCEGCRCDGLVINTGGQTRGTKANARFVGNWVDTTQRSAITGVSGSDHGFVAVGPVSDLLVAGNVFRLGKGNAIVTNDSGQPGLGPGNALNAKNVVVRDNVVVREQYDATQVHSGIVVTDCDDAKVTNNKVDGQCTLIELQRCANAVVSGNVGRGRYTGAEDYVAPSDSLEADPMHATLHPRYGLQLTNCRDCVVSNNALRGYHWQPLIEDAGTAAGSKPSRRNVIVGNQLYNNYKNAGIDAGAAPGTVWANNVARPG